MPPNVKDSGDATMGGKVKTATKKEDRIKKKKM